MSVITNKHCYNYAITMHYFAQTESRYNTYTVIIMIPYCKVSPAKPNSSRPPAQPRAHGDRAQGYNCVVGSFITLILRTMFPVLLHYVYVDI